MHNNPLLIKIHDYLYVLNYVHNVWASHSNQTNQYIVWNSTSLGIYQGVLALGLAPHKDYYYCMLALLHQLTLSKFILQ